MLTDAVAAERHTTSGGAGRLNVYVSGRGAPLLLLHSINAAGSAYEIKPLFDHYRTSRRVYAPDLPGFGRSDRTQRVYDVRLYVNAIHDVMTMIAADTDETGVDALALSLTSEFLARAAVQRPDGFRSLALVTPTGFRSGSEELRAPAGSTREMPLLSTVLNVPLWRRGLYQLLVKPASIRYFLKRTWGSADYDEGLARYDDWTTHQPGAEHAPLAFLSGRLFSRDIRNIYERLELPVWLPHGTRGDFRDFSGAEWTRSRDNWTVQPFATGALPHFEQRAHFCELYDRFLASVG